MTKTITFRVIQLGNDIKNGDIVGVREIIGDFPATLPGIRKAFKAANDACYGREQGRIAPTGRGYVFAYANGEPIIVGGTNQMYEITTQDMDADWVSKGSGRKTTKTELLARLLRTISQHVAEQP